MLIKNNYYLTLCLPTFLNNSNQMTVFPKEVRIEGIDQKFPTIILIFLISINSSIEMNFNAFNDWHYRNERASKNHCHQSCMTVFYPDTC